MSTPDINSMEDEDELHKLLQKTEDFDQRKKIRARMKEVRENKAAEWEKKRAEQAAGRESAVAMKQRQAAAAQQKSLKDLDSKADEKRNTAKPSVREEAIKQRHANAAAEKQEQMKALEQKSSYIKQAYSAGRDLVGKHDGGKKPGSVEESTSTSTKTDTGKDGSKTTTTTTTTTKKTSGPAGGGATRPNFLGAPGGGGGAAEPAGGGPGLTRSPSAIKQMLLEWTKQQTAGYNHVSITNFSSSWNDGMAFCALIHSFCPKFDYSKLDPKRRRANFTLAFAVAEKEADIAPLLDVDDMVRMQKPDWKCVFTYVQSFYRKFRMQENKNPGSPVTPTTPNTPLSPEPTTQ